MIKGFVQELLGFFLKVFDKLEPPTRYKASYKTASVVFVSPVKKSIENLPYSISLNASKIPDTINGLSLS